MKGKIEKYLSNRGYGFIELEDSEDNIFFHISNYPKTMLPTNGQEVEFELIETPKGKEATKIQLIEKSSETVETKEVEPKEEPVEVENLDTLNGVGPTYQKLLRAAGIKSKEKLATMKPEELFKTLNDVNEEKAITKRPPTLANVEAWIGLAKE